jgi:hemin uptake protein HemP
MTTEHPTADCVTGDSAAAAPVPRREGTDAPPRVVSSDSLLAGGSQLAILHNQSVYFLRQTRFGKLILTK